MQAQEIRQSQESDSTVIDLLQQILTQLKSLNYYASPDSGAGAHLDDYSAASWMGEAKNKRILLKIHEITAKMMKNGHEKLAIEVRDSLNEAIANIRDRKRILNEEIYDIEQRMRL